MLQLILSFILGLSLIACTKSNKEASISYQAASIQQQGADYLIAEISPGIAQQLGPLEISGLEGLVMRWPADLIDSAQTVRISQGPSLVGRHLPEALGSEVSFTVVSAGPTLHIGMEDPFSSMRFLKDMEILWPRDLLGQDLAADASLQVISLKPDETIAHIYSLEKLGLTGSDPVQINSQTVGHFQIVQTSGLSEQALPLQGAVGTGSWYGYEANFANFVDRLTSAEISQLELIYDQKGNNLHYYVNGSELLIPPGSSFLDFASSDPLIFDSSSGESLRPWIFSPDQSHGVMFSALGRTAVMLITMVQRQAFDNFDSMADLSQINGTWQGLHLVYDFDGRKPFFTKQEESDRLNIRYDDEALHLSGSLGGVASDEVSLAESSSFGRSLGLYTGLWAGQKRLYLAISQDRKAIGYMLCDTRELDDCGDGKTASQRFDAYKFRYGLLKR